MIQSLIWWGQNITWLGQSLIWWIVQYSIVFMGMINFYLVIHATMKFKLTFNYKHIAVAIGATFILAPMYLLDIYLLRTFGLLFQLFMVKWVSRRKNGDVIVIFALTWAIGATVQAPIGAVIFSAQRNLNFYQPFVYFTVSLLTVLGVVFVSKKYKLNEWFNVLRLNLALRFALLLYILIIIVSTFIINFELKSMFFLHFTVAILLVGIAFSPIFAKNYSETKRKLSQHDMRSAYLSILSIAPTMKTVEELTEEIKEKSEKFGIDLRHVDEEHIQKEMDEVEANEQAIKTFIKLKQYDTENNVQIGFQAYYGPDSLIKLSTALIWLGIMLDNAIEASENNPVIVDIFSTDDEFILDVSNEYRGETDNIKLFFELGYSTKQWGRGIGLYNLYTEVTELKGTVDARTSFSEEYGCDYLHIGIKIKATS